MAKVLKLDRISTFVSPAIENKLLERNETVRVDDKTAEYLLSGFELGDGGTEFPRFIEVSDPDGDMHVTHDCIILKEERMNAEREAKGLATQLAAPPLRHQRAHVEDADSQPVDDEEDAPAPRRSHTPPVAAKKAPARRIPARS